MEESTNGNENILPPEVAQVFEAHYVYRGQITTVYTALVLITASRHKYLGTPYEVAIERSSEAVLEVMIYLSENYSKHDISFKNIRKLARKRYINQYRKDKKHDRNVPLDQATSHTIDTTKSHEKSPFQDIESDMAISQIITRTLQPEERKVIEALINSVAQRQNGTWGRNVSEVATRLNVPRDKVMQLVRRAERLLAAGLNLPVASRNTSPETSMLTSRFSSATLRLVRSWVLSYAPKSVDDDLYAGIANGNEWILNIPSTYADNTQVYICLNKDIVQLENQQLIIKQPLRVHQGRVSAVVYVEGLAFPTSPLLPSTLFDVRHISTLSAT